MQEVCVSVSTLEDQVERFCPRAAVCCTPMEAHCPSTEGGHHLTACSFASCDSVFHP